MREALTLPLTKHLNMLSRRIFRELTDRILLESTCRSTPAVLFAAKNSLCHSEGAVKVFVNQRASSSSSTRWKSRQGKDHFAREARVQGLKSRAAFKLLEVC